MTAWWQQHGYTIIHADSDPDLPFNVSQARNNAVRAATTDLVIVADADTIPDLPALQTAIYACTRHGGVWYPFTDYRYLDPSVQPGEDLTQAPVEQGYPNSVGGLLVIQRTEYWRLGGYDERFTVWGGEDRAFELAAVNLSTTHRIPGTVYAFNHQADRNMRGPWRHILDQYRSAHRTGRMAEYLTTRG